MKGEPDTLSTHLKLRWELPNKSIRDHNEQPRWDQPHKPIQDHNKIRAIRKVHLHLPYELAFKILSTLPVKSLIRFKFVCKEWNYLISHPDFIKNHLKLATDTQNLTLQRHIAFIKEPHPFPSISCINYHTLNLIKLDLPFASSFADAEILSSCNGLLLVGIGSNSHFLWNPSTRLYKKIPCPYDHFKDFCRLYGLGYDASSDSYKVVRIVRVTSYRNYLAPPQDPGQYYDSTHVRVYNCKTKVWRRIEYFPYRIFVNGQGIIANGAPHWVVTRDTGIKIYVIIFFNLAEEKFEEVENPSWVDSNSSFDLGVLGGFLCLVQYRCCDNEIWVMKESWTKLFSISRTYFTRVVPFSFTENNEVVLETSKNKLTIYSLKGGKANGVLSFDNSNGFNAAAYVETLVSPPGENETME